MEKESLENMSERAIYTIVEKAKKYDALVKPFWDNQLHCSFCGITQDRVEVLIAGPKGVYICNQCIITCNDVIAEHQNKKPQKNWSSFQQKDGDRRIISGVIMGEGEGFWEIQVSPDDKVFSITKEGWTLLDE